MGSYHESGLWIVFCYLGGGLFMLFSLCGAVIVIISCFVNKYFVIYLRDRLIILLDFKFSTEGLIVNCGIFWDKLFQWCSLIPKEHFSIIYTWGCLLWFDWVLRTLDVCICAWVDYHLHLYVLGCIQPHSSYHWSWEVEKCEKNLGKKIGHLLKPLTTS